MRLIIDIGNSKAKIGLFNGDDIIEALTVDNLSENSIGEILHKNHQVKNCIISSVASDTELLKSFLEKCGVKVLLLDYFTRLPIENFYETKESLGYDRIAAAVGASAIFPGENILIVDAGSALTVDFINSNSEYLGGNISPGIEMRFKALNMFTKNLPLLNINNEYQLTGKTTGQAIINGVLNGIVFEIEKYMEEYSKQYKDIKTVITGGDCYFFEKKIKNPIFANSNLVLTGLNRILAENEA